MTMDHAQIKLKFIAHKAMVKQPQNPWGHAFFWAVFRPTGAKRYRKAIILITDGRENLGKIEEEIRAEVAKPKSGIELSSLYFNMD